MMRIAATVVKFQIDGAPGDDTRTAIHAGEIEIQKMLGLDPTDVLVVSAKESDIIDHAWDVEFLLPGKND